MVDKTNTTENTENIVRFERRFKWLWDFKFCKNRSVADEHGNIYYCRKHLEERHAETN